MNYIKQLQRQIDCLQAQLRSMDADIVAMKHYLNTDKFVGVDTDGERKDWIATGDVLSWLQAVRNNSFYAGENAYVEFNDHSKDKEAMAMNMENTAALSLQGE